MNKPRILVFASGSATGGGSGFEQLVTASRGGPLDANIVAVVSNHEHGGVRQRADKLNIPFVYFHQPFTGEEYQHWAQIWEADFCALSGWLKKVSGLDPATNFNSKTVFNIHPGPLPQFGGPGLYGHHVHEAVIAAFKRHEITHSAVSMHFVTAEYDQGPVFLNYRVKINEDETAESLAHRVNDAEHYYQPRITNLVVNGRISWDGINPDSLICPHGYAINSSDIE